MPFCTTANPHRPKALWTSRAEAEFERGARLFSERRITAALDAFHLARSLGYEANRCAAYRWQCWMLLGEFEQAWRESDRISASGAPDPDAVWDGKPFAGERVVIRCLHGYGDAIQFLRYAAPLRARASRIVVETHPEMVSLLERLPHVDAVTTWEGGRSPRREDWDRQIEVTELPRAFRTTLATIPYEVPYFDIAPEAVLCSARNLGVSTTHGKKIGLVWASSAWNPARSIPLADLLPLLQTENCAFYSFQRGPERACLAELPAARGIHDTALHSPDIVDTAADLMNMDLLVTVDTMAAHLAGALGKPVWTLLPFEADWRWMLDRSDTPWYPSMRLFRQASPGNWKRAVEAVARELARFAA